MDQPDAVRLGQPGADLAHQVNDASGGQRTVTAHQVAQALALKVLHHIIERAVAGETVIEDFDRVGVRKPGCRLHFALESRHGDGVGPRLGLDQLQGTGTLEQVVLGQVDLAHPAFAELAHELVLAELASDMQLGPQAVESTTEP